VTRCTSEKSTSPPPFRNRVKLNRFYSLFLSYGMEFLWILGNYTNGTYILPLSVKFLNVSWSTRLRTESNHNRGFAIGSTEDTII
jgi:hypothetical protein